jgi:citrate lyase subunit beta/citryl-CoA lyase
MADAPWVLRSLLFVPGNRPAMIAKARTLGADALILDLEDGVAPDEKEQARRTVAEALETGFPESLVVFLRANGPESGLLDTDLREAFRPRCQGVCLPKCEIPASVLASDARLRIAEDEWGTARGRVRLLPMIETAAGVLRAPAIARACPRICALGFGAEDFTANVGLVRSREGTELAWARTAVSLAAHAAGALPIDGIFADFRDEAGLRADTDEARRHGFAGKMLIHPAQIAPVHAAFAPTPEEVEHARAVVAAYAQARAAGSGVAVVDGAMVDRPVVLRAERVLAAAERGGRAPGSAGHR